MGRLSSNDRAYNACIDAANRAQSRLMDALDDYNRAVTAAEALRPLGHVRFKIEEDED